MTGGITRRRVLSGTASGALAGMAVLATPLWAAQPIQIPKGPMRLVRRLERGLRGGAIITVERVWRVAFAQQGSGVAIAGEQIDASVDAPAKLAPLARIERTRSTADMFPILLTAEGMIAAVGQYTRETDVDEAVRLAEAEIANRRLPAEAKKEQMLYLAQLQRTASSFLKQLPRDLFFPASEPTRTVRKVNLPNGLLGEFEVAYEARTAPRHGWLDLAVRRVVTRIGESVRHSREVWSMSEF